MNYKTRGEHHESHWSKGRRAISIDICLHSIFFKNGIHTRWWWRRKRRWGGGLFSKKGWRRKSGSAWGGDGDAIYVPMKKLAGWSCKLIFDKLDRFVHPVAIARKKKRKERSSQVERMEKRILTCKQSLCNQWEQLLSLRTWSVGWYCRRKGVNKKDIHG